MKCINRIGKLIIFGFLGIFIFGLSGCYPKKIGFRDFPQFKEFGDDIVSVDIRWGLDGNSESHIITDKETVDEIVAKLVEETKFIRKKTSQQSGTGDFRNVRFTDGEGTITRVALYPIRYGESKTYYKYENQIFFNMLEKIIESAHSSS